MNVLMVVCELRTSVKNETKYFRHDFVLSSFFQHFFQHEHVTGQVL